MLLLRNLMLCLSDTYLDSSKLSDNDNFNLTGYNVVRDDHPSNTRKGSVCIYFKNFLSFKLLDIQLLQECINFEIKITDKNVILYLCIDLPVNQMN